MPKPLTVFLFRGHGEVMSMSEMLSFGACSKMRSSREALALTVLCNTHFSKVYPVLPMSV